MLWRHPVLYTDVWCVVGDHSYYASNAKTDTTSTAKHAGLATTKLGGAKLFLSLVQVAEDAVFAPVAVAVDDAVLVDEDDVVSSDSV